jgi:hypothetical protein
VALRRALAPAFGKVRVSVTEGSRLEVEATSGAQGWSIASYLLTRAPRLGLARIGYDGRDWEAGSDEGWRRGGPAGAQSVVVG